MYTNKLLRYRDFVRYSTTLVETGSAAGDGIQRALDAGFKNVHSIEAAEPWYKVCVERFRGNEAVKLHLGKSTDVLKTLSLLSHSVFFLDAHPSGPLSAGHADVMENGANSEFSQDNVIKAELDIILGMDNFPVVIIDDQNGLDDYSSIYIEMLRKAHPEYIIEFYDENLGGDHFYANKILVARYE